MKRTVMTANLQPSVPSKFGADTPAMEVVAGHDLTGRRAIVTGGASGIGIETTRALASAGAEVTIAARKLEVAEASADTLNSELGARRVDAQLLDLADLGSVREFSARWGNRSLSLLI